MDMFEIEVALNNDEVLTYLDTNTYTQCFFRSIGADTVLHTRQTTYDDITNYISVSDLLYEIHNKNFYVDIA